MYDLIFVFTNYIHIKSTMNMKKFKIDIFHSDENAIRIIIIHEPYCLIWFSIFV